MGSIKLNLQYLLLSTVVVSEGASHGYGPQTSSPKYHACIMQIFHRKGELIVR